MSGADLRFKSLKDSPQILVAGHYSELHVRFGHTIYIHIDIYNKLPLTTPGFLTLLSSQTKLFKII